MITKKLSLPAHGYIGITYIILEAKSAYYVWYKTVRCNNALENALKVLIPFFPTLPTIMACLYLTKTQSARLRAAQACYAAKFMFTTYFLKPYDPTQREYIVDADRLSTKCARASIYIIIAILASSAALPAMPSQTLSSLHKQITSRMLNASSCASWIAWFIRYYHRSSELAANQATNCRECKLALNLAHLSALNAVGLHLAPTIASDIITVAATASAATASCLIIYNGM